MCVAETYSRDGGSAVCRHSDVDWSIYYYYNNNIQMTSFDPGAVWIANDGQTTPSTPVCPCHRWPASSASDLPPAHLTHKPVSVRGGCNLIAWSGICSIAHRVISAESGRYNCHYIWQPDLQLKSNLSTIYSSSLSPPPSYREQGHMSLGTFFGVGGS